MYKPQQNQPTNTEPKVERRKLISFLAVGTVGLVTVATVGGVTFAHEMDDRWRGDGSVVTRKRTPTSDHGHGHDKGDDGYHPSKTPTATKSPTPKPTQQPQPTPKPTTQPTQAPTPTPAPSTGTAIGSTSQATNTAVAFTNPADGQPSWLVHMSNGNFVAVEQACTHAGVAVKYNPATGLFNCPAHGAIFNADGSNPQSPANTPLPSVHIVVNANGTITTP